MKTKEILEKTMSSSDYRRALKIYLYNYEGRCDLCRPHRGCNRSERYHGESSWKSYRKHQWKD